MFPPSMAARLLLFYSHVVSLTAYKAQLALMSREVLLATTKAVQRVVKAPWQAVPTQFLQKAKLFGFPTEAHDVALRARAAALRAALGSSVLAVVEARVETFKVSDAAALDPRRPRHITSLFS